MIKINLARRKQAGGAMSGGGGGTRSGSTGFVKFDFNSSLERFKDPELVKPFRRAFLPVVVAILGTYTLDSYKASEVQKVVEQIVQVNAQKPKLQAELSQYKAIEEIKKTLEADEFAIRTKIDTIQKLIAGRGVAPKILVSVASSLPESVWLSDLKINDGQVALMGFSVNMGQVSDFMKSLGESVYFTELNLKNSQQVKGEGGVEITSFELGAKRK